MVMTTRLPNVDQGVRRRAHCRRLDHPAAVRRRGVRGQASGHSESFVEIADDVQSKHAECSDDLDAVGMELTDAAWSKWERDPGGALKAVRRTFLSRRDTARRLNQLACGVTTDHVDSLFGPPPFRFSGPSDKSAESPGSSARR